MVKEKSMPPTLTKAEVFYTSYDCSCGLNSNRRGVQPFKGQKYLRLKSECVSKIHLFVDTIFPANTSSLYIGKGTRHDVEWRRPGEIVENPRLVTQGMTSEDMTQGALGNCWFVAACACISQDKKLLSNVLPNLDEQEWNPRKPYAGIFHFQFWWTGCWFDVVIDDFLPTKNGRLLYVHSKDTNEFWSALLEKAYAKLFGSYEALVAGKARDALVNMTGGMGNALTIERHMNNKQKMAMWDVLCEGFDDGSLMAASVAVSGNDGMESKISCGLIRGHAYSITSVKKIRLGHGIRSIISQEKVYMIRLRNPWGGVEWNGPWSDNSPEMTRVSHSQKKDLGIVFQNDGEFWMEFGDFCKYFTHVDICYIFNTSIFSFKAKWNCKTSEQQWHKGGRAGGCLNYPTFLHNHQYLLEVFDDGKYLFSLEQEDRRQLMVPGTKNFTIGVSITEVDLNRKYRMHVRASRVQAGPFVDSRSSMTTVNLVKNNYLVVPSTFEPNLEGKFIFRVVSKSKFNFKELNRDMPPEPSCWDRAYQSAVSVTVVKGKSLARKEKPSSQNMYCVLKCEGEEINTKNVANTENPKWDSKATFYRKEVNSPVYVEVWNDKFLAIDDFLGFIEVQLDKHNDVDYMVRYPLTKKMVGDDSRQVPGYLWIQAQLTFDFNDI